MKKYKLGFISDEDLYNHVKETVVKYRFSIDLLKFKKNLIDPIKLTFDSKVYSQDMEQVVEAEIIRQMDKSNTNHIGYFHQNIFRYIGKGWTVLSMGYDIVNEEKAIFVELKNKHNTMNAASSRDTFTIMQSTILENPNAKCFLVEVIARRSQNITWKKKVNRKQLADDRIRRVSIDRFYEFVTGDKNAFRDLCQMIPKVMAMS